MKRLLAVISFALFACAGLASVASAESVDVAPLVIEIPENWTQNPKDLNENRVAVFTDPQTESRIEVYRRQMTREAHAEVLFDAFHEQLTTNEMTVIEPPLPRRIDLLNGDNLQTKYGEYAYDSPGIPISVITCSFTKSETAYIIVGYFVRTNRADGIEIFDTFLKKAVDTNVR